MVKQYFRNINCANVIFNLTSFEANEFLYVAFVLRFDEIRFKTKLQHFLFRYKLFAMVFILLKLISYSNFVTTNR